MMIGMISMTAFANGTGSITIQSPSDTQATVEGKTFNVYKIFNATTSGTSTSYSWYTITNGDTTVIPFYDFFYGANGVVEKNVQNGSVQRAVDYVSNFEDNIVFSQFAESLYEYVSDASRNIAPFKTGHANTGETSVTISDLSYGYYMIYDATIITGSAVRSAVMLTTVNDNVVVTLKANRPGVQKQVLENDGSTWGKGTSSMIGDVVEFRIDTYIPSHKLYSAYEYYIDDILPAGLNLYDAKGTNNEDIADVLVYKVTESYDSSTGTIVETETLISSENYSLIMAGDQTTLTSGAKFRVSFTEKIDAKDANNNLYYNVGDKIRIKYKAEVTGNIAAMAPNENKAILYYSNDPTKNDSTNMSENTVGSTSDYANVYVYQFIFTKFAEDAHGVFVNKRLAGAKFELWKVKGESKTKLHFATSQVHDENDEAHAAYTKYTVTDAPVGNGVVDVLEVNPNGDESITLNHYNYGGHKGDVFIFGLSEGTYEIKEVEAPAGYVLPDTPFTITIMDEIGALGTVGRLEVTTQHDEKNDVGKIMNAHGTGEAILTVWADITNHPGAALPNTGGIGSTIYMVAGLAIMVSAAAVLVYKKRNSAK